MFPPVSTHALGSDVHFQSSSPLGQNAGGVRSRFSDLASKATEFEAILLGQWLQGSETAFGSVPGGDDDEDAGADQMKSFAFQHLASGLAEKGGIGIAKLVYEAMSSELKASSPSGAVQTSADGQGQTIPSRPSGGGTEQAKGLNPKERQ